MICNMCSSIFVRVACTWLVYNLITLCTAAYIDILKTLISDYMSYGSLCFSITLSRNIYNINININALLTLSALWSGIRVQIRYLGYLQMVVSTSAVVGLRALLSLIFIFEIQEYLRQLRIRNKKS